MLAHNLKERVIIQKKTSVKNPGTGSLADTWNTIMTVSAEVKYNTGNETIDKGRVNGYSVDFIIRYRSEIDTNCQVLWNDQKFNIQAIEPIGRKETLRLKCQRF